MKYIIDEQEMYKAWTLNNSKFYKLLYTLASIVYSRMKQRPIHIKRADLIQSAVIKCWRHKNAYNVNKGRIYSFFYKQIILSFRYDERKLTRTNKKDPMFGHFPIFEQHIEERTNEIDRILDKMTIEEISKLKMFELERLTGRYSAVNTLKNKIKRYLEEHE
jgi:hypothetical protein